MTRAADYPLEAAVRQSPPIDYGQAVDDAWVKDKTVVIVGVSMIHLSEWKRN